MQISKNAFGGFDMKQPLTISPIEAYKMQGASALPVGIGGFCAGIEEIFDVELPDSLQAKVNFRSMLFTVFVAGYVYSTSGGGSDAD